MINNNSIVAFLTLLFIGGIHSSIVEFNIRAHYYYKNTPSVARLSQTTDDQYFPPDDLKTVFVIHGWDTKSLKRPLQVKNIIFRNCHDVGRVIIIDWVQMSSRSPYRVAAKYEVPKVAEFVGAEIKRIITKNITVAGKIEIVGHSLGAHVAGRAARMMINERNETVGLIVGLDPAGVVFFRRESKKSLQTTDASKVLVIHTNAGVLGIDYQVNDEDIWVNGGKSQKGCKWWNQVCCHKAAWDAYIKLLQNKPLFEKGDTFRGRNTEATTSGNSKKSILLEAELSSTTLQYPNPLTIEVGIRRGERAIFSADITAQIKSLNGEVTILKLLDNGVGADMQKDDGVYSRYISKLAGEEEYKVSVLATDNGNNAEVKKNGKRKKTGTFRKFIDVGLIRANGTFIKPLPGVVTDLHIVQIDMERRSCRIEWTAPGEQLDIGTVAGFSIMATANLTHAIQNVDQFIFNDTNAENRAELQPKEAGGNQTVNLKIPDALWDSAIREDDLMKVELYFTVQSRNEHFQYSNMSNLADSLTYYVTARDRKPAGSEKKTVFTRLKKILSRGF